MLSRNGLKSQQIIVCVLVILDASLTFRGARLHTLVAIMPQFSVCRLWFKSDYLEM